MNPVPARLRTNVHHRVIDTLGDAGEDLFFLDDAEGKSIDENIGVVALVEEAFAAHRGHPDTVAVAADAGDHAGQQVARARVSDAAKTQRVERRDGPRAHGEDIAQNAAHASGRALIGLNE